MTNPLMTPSLLPFGMIDTSQLKAEHFAEAFAWAMQEQVIAYDRIAADSEAATFDNTFVPLELSGLPLSRVSKIFDLLTETTKNQDLADLKKEIAPVLSRHFSALAQREDIFARIKTVYEAPETLALDQRLLVEDRYIAATRSGVGQPDEIKAKLTDINARLSDVTTEFENRLKAQLDEQPFWVENRNDLAGVPDDLIDAAAKAAGQPGRFAFRLSEPSVLAVLGSCHNRELRERYFTAFTQRNDSGAYDTSTQILLAHTLKQERASLLGYSDYATLALERNMAGSPEAAHQLMADLWRPAKAKYAQELAERQELAAQDGLNEPLKPWDWPYYSARLSQTKYALDEGEVSKYLKLENVQAALFDACHRLFGITMVARPDLPVHHPDAHAWEVRNASGQPIAIFMDDFFARAGKAPGAWMDELQGGHGLNGGQNPVVYNSCNFTKPADGAPALLSLDDAITMFHEFGHALHGMLTKAQYPSQSGTRVRRDNVELPSQFLEHYLTVPEIMKAHLRHIETGAPMPDDMISRIRASHNMDSGYEMTRYLMSTFIDLELHRRPAGSIKDINRFEQEMLEKYEMPAGLPARHRLPHFSHSFRGYSAQYYVYRWADVYCYDAFAAFTQTGNPFDPALARSFLSNILETGGSRPPEQNYLAFRGKPASSQALLKGKGFIAA